MKFDLLGKSIEISEGRKNYMKILATYKSFALKAKSDFDLDYNQTAYCGRERPLMRL